MLPLSRNTTYTTSTPPKSVDLNDLQDCAIGGKHGEIAQQIPPESAVPLTPANWAFDGETWTHTAGGGFSALQFGLVIPVGAEILGFTVFYRRLAGANIQADLYRRVLSTGALDNILSTDVDTTSSARTNMVADFTVPETVTADRVYAVHFNPGGSTDQVYGAQLRWRKV